ncbi:unnamed protein product, partial [Polarella glacialis]
MRLFSQSQPLLRSASWNLSALQPPPQFDSGGGPTIAHTVTISRRREDVDFVAAAASGD